MIDRFQFKRGGHTYNFFLPKQCSIQQKYLSHHELPKVLQPQQVFSAVLVDHVLMQEIGSAGFNSSDLQILVESLLKILIQIPRKRDDELKKGKG